MAAPRRKKYLTDDEVLQMITMDSQDSDELDDSVHDSDYDPDFNDLDTSDEPDGDAVEHNDGAGERNVGAGERDDGAGERNVGAGEHDVGAGEHDDGAGERDDGAGERNVGAGERNVCAGERNVGAGERDDGAGERDVGAGERNVGAGDGAGEHNVGAEEHDGGAAELGPADKGKRLSRKRVRDEKSWKRNVKKRLRVSGKSYSPVKAKKKQRERSLVACDCGPGKCRIKCSERISEDQRRAIFEEFYNLGSWNEQTIFIANSIQINKVNRPTTHREDSRRANSRAYYMTVRDDQQKITTVKVCKRMFMSTLDINTARIDYALQKKASGELTDQRGKAPAGNRTPEAAVQRVKQHIGKFPRYVSHYTRHHSQKEYLKGVSSIEAMYRLYKEECELDEVDPVSNWVYHNIFNTQFNLSFHVPKKDTCKRCDIFKVTHSSEQDEDKKREIMREWDNHHDLAERTRAKLNADKAKCKDDNNIGVFTFDLQKTKPLPYLNTNEVYYKRQLAFYNCGIHDYRTEAGYFRMWHECVASRGSAEIASCLWHWLKTLQVKGDLPEHLLAYADSCGGQNRNINIALFWQYVLQNLPCKIVDQIFMVSGHSFLASDEDFGVDEKEKRKHETVFTPAEWMAIAKRARKKHKFDVALLQTKDFLNFKILKQQIVNRKVDMEGGKVEWLQIRWLRFVKDEPYKIYFKYAVDEEQFRCIDIAKRTRGRPGGTYLIEIPVLYPDGRAVSKVKYQDIMSLMKYVPPCHQGFYKSLQHDGQEADVEVDLDISLHESDAEEDGE